MRPHRTRGSGVAHFYDCIAPYLGDSVCYVHVGSRSVSAGVPSHLIQVVGDFVRFAMRCARSDIAFVHVNPSFDRKSLIRDGFFLLLARVMRRSTIVFFRGWEETTAQNVESSWLTPFRFVFFRAAAICVLYSGFAETLRKWGYTGPLRVVTTVVGDEITEKLLGSAQRRSATPDQVVVAFMARVAKKKGIFETVEAVRMARKVGCNIELLVIGDGPDLRQAQAVCERSGLAGVTFTGHLEQAAKAAALARADIYVLPTSESEGMPNSALEAMALGLPAVVTPVTGLQDIARLVPIGVLLERPTANAIRDALVQLAGDPELRRRVGRANARLACRAFTAETVAARLGTLYETLADGKSEPEGYEAWYDCIDHGSLVGGSIDD